MEDSNQSVESHIPCPRWGYDLFGLPGEKVTCPECGLRCNPRDLLAKQKPDPYEGYWGGVLCFFLWCVALCAVRDYSYESLSVAVILPPIFCSLLGYGFPEYWWRPVFVFLAWPAFTALLTIIASLKMGFIERFQEGGAMLLSIALSILLACGCAHLRRNRERFKRW